MAAIRLSKRSLFLGLLAFASVGCTTPDPEGTVSDFEARRQASLDERARNKPDMGAEDPLGCAARADVNGAFMLAVDTTIAPGFPLLFEATVTYDGAADPPTISMSLKPLAAADRSVIEPPYTVLEMTEDTPLITETAPVNADGTFEIDFGTVSVVGAANGITGRDIQATLTASGEIRSTDTICGRIAGDLIYPDAFDLGPTDLAPNGSTMGLVRVEGGDYSEIEPLVSCPPCSNDEMGDDMGGDDMGGAMAEGG
jgi:hypothetical protein